MTLSLSPREGVFNGVLFLGQRSYDSEGYEPIQAKIPPFLYREGEYVLQVTEVVSYDLGEVRLHIF
jgi:hypothetical protein